MITRYALGALLIMIMLLCGATLLLRAQETYILCVNSGDSAIDCGIFSIKNNKPQLLFVLQTKNEDISNFTDAVCDIITRVKNYHAITIQHACFSAPGVPSANQDYLTHWRLPYAIDAKEIIKKSGLKTAIIINNFLALSYGVDAIDEKDITPLHDVPAELHGQRAIIGAGDGLGSVVMVWNEEKNSYMSLPAEAGTGNFPAFTQFEFDLAERMKQERGFDTVHWAFFVAVPGIEYTYKILKNMNRYEDSLHMVNPDGLAILAHAHDDELCKETANLFFKIYARFAYNFVWTTLPFGGLYLVGSTATDYPELLSEIFLPEFFNCVPSKQELVKRVPVFVIHAEDNVKLYGAAHYLLLEKNIA